MSLIGRSLAHYRILERIGAGGQGHVYRAMDERLGRHVAIKVLPEGALDDSTLCKRFWDEATSQAKLHHPNICVIFSFENAAGLDYIVMEWVAGISLAQKVTAGPIPESTVLALGVDIAEALAHAHAGNIIHRDLKPANVMLTPLGRAKVLDFGLAKYLNPLGSSTESVDSTTRTGRIVGTLPYMAPELFEGLHADVRTDVYGAGAVLYELATGRRPFLEHDQASLTTAILRGKPPAPRSINPRISQGLEKIILMAMHRDPSSRYQDAEALGQELRACGSQVQEPRPRVQRVESLAVLPLANHSLEPGQDYFADGMTEALISTLAQIRALHVVSRQSVMQFKNVTRSLPEIARELNVDALVEGSVLRHGDRVRIAAQLIEASSDRHLWAGTYERDLRDILQLQSEVAWAIAQEVRVTVMPKEAERIREVRKVDPEAYQAYLKGRQFWNKRNAESIRKAIECFELAIQRDPNYPLAYVGLADCFFTVGFYVDVPPSKMYPRGKAVAQQALALDDNLAEAYASMGLAKFLYDWDPIGSEESLQRSVELNNSYATAHQWYAELLTGLGRFDEAIAHAMQALESDPLSHMINSCAGWVLYRSRRYDEAIQQLRNALEISADFVPALYFLNLALIQNSMFSEAVRVSEKIVEAVPGSQMTRANLAHAYAAAGRRQEARSILVELLDGMKSHYVQAYFIAKIYMALHEYDRVFVWLDTALRERSPWLAWIGVEPLFDPVRDDPRFQDLLRTIGLTSESRLHQQSA